MPNYKSSGEENLRANEKAMSGEMTSTPSAKGTNCGGESTSDSKTMAAGVTKTTPQGSAKVPSGVKSYPES